MMQLHLLKSGQTVKTKHLIRRDRIMHWRYGRECADVGGGLMAGATLRVVQVHAVAPTFALLELPGRSPAAYLKVSGDEMAANFTMTLQTGPVTAARPIPSLNLTDQFRRLGRRQAAVKDGIDILREARAQLANDATAANWWSSIDLFANAALLPLNIIINAFEAKAALTIYQKVVEEFYKQFSQSGGRIDDALIKEGLGSLKRAVVDHLRQKGLTKYVPGVNILVGVAEDATALFESARRHADGSNEMRTLMRQLDAKYAAAYSEFLKIGIEMDRLLTEIDRRNRTA
jgi:hypothetical protein